MNKIFTVLLLATSSAGLSSAAIGQLPLSFEPNQGQGDPRSKFFARGPGYTVALRPDGATISSRGNAKSGKTSLTTMHLTGALASSKPVATDELPGKVNYFIGSQRNWRTSLPTYGKVEFPHIYPGIDISYYGTAGKLEYDFMLQPGADPALIRMRFTGAGTPRLNASGDLEIGDVRQHKPVAYQKTGSARTEVACRYVLHDNRDVTLALGSYDRGLPLIIDPVISYASYVGGSGNDTVASIKVDASGNLYMAGFTTSANLPGRGGAQPAYAGSNSALLQAQFGDAFVAKLNPSGTAMLYATYLGGSGDDFATSLAIDAAGNAYVTGATQSANFPTTTGSLQRSYKGFDASDDNGFYNPGDGFVAKLNPTGSALVYSTYLGGGLNDLPLGITADAAGNAIIVGTTKSTDFPTTANALSKSYRGAVNTGSAVAGDAFVSILNPAGSALTYSTYLGGRGHDAARGVTLDAQNNIYVCGMTSSGDFPVTPGALQTSYLGNENIVDFDHPVGHGFVAKISPAGALVYGTYVGGSVRDAVSAIAVDSTGAAWVTGATASEDFPVTASALQKTNKGRGTAGSLGDINYGDVFVSKLNPAGSALTYSTYLGGTADDTATDLAIDQAGNAYITGFTLSSDFPVTADALQTTNAGFGGQGLAPNAAYQFPERVRNSGDAFLVKLSAAGALVYSSFFGGRNDDAGLSVAVDAAGNAYVAGNTLSTTIPTTAGALQQPYGGGGNQFPRGDGFVVKFSFGGSLALPPSRVNIISGFASSGTPGSTLSTPFTVEVVDAQGAKLSGILVNFSATGATVNPASAMTNAQGRASTNVTLGSTPGTATVRATVPGIPVASADIVVSATAAPLAVKAIVNGASFQPSIAPGSWITVYIDQTAPQNATASVVPLPNALAGYRVLVNGSPVPVYAVYPLSSGTQINAQLPYEVAAGSATVTVESSGVSSAPFTFSVQPAAPGIFVFGENHAVAQNVLPDNSLVVNTPDTPVPAGDFIVAYLTGQGALDNPVQTGNVAGGTSLSVPNLPYSATLGGRPVTVTFLGMTPGQIALAQANIQIPADMDPGTYPLVIKVGTAESNGPSITVGPRRQ